MVGKIIPEHRDDIIQLNIKQICKILWSKRFFVLVSALLGAIAFMLLPKFLVAPKYRSSVTFYVDNGTNTGENNVTVLEYGDIDASKKLVDSYISILYARSCLNDIKNYCGLDCSASSLANMISAFSVDSTEVFSVVITSSHPEEAELIANAVAQIFPKKVSEIIKGTSANTVDFPCPATLSNAPNVKFNLLIGAISGGVLACVFFIMRVLCDNAVSNEDDVRRISNLPVLLRLDSPAETQRGKLVFDKRYRVLSSKIPYYFSSKNRAVIGVTSYKSGEGKSETAINIAYSFAEESKRVLLIDCDMKRSALSKKTDTGNINGLSDYLCGRCEFASAVLKYGAEFEPKFDFLPSGSFPPNPSGLLNSEKNKKTISVLRKYYDYIILDLPAVYDQPKTMHFYQWLDGIVITLDRNYTPKNAFRTAIETLKSSNDRIIGVVLNKKQKRTKK